MLRAQSVVAAGALLLVGLFVAPACSTSTADGPGCTNGARDEGEEGIDCGGICPSKCTGARCAASEECASGKCENGVCGAPAGKTCGVGAGLPCKDGDACELDKDCTSAFCDAGHCGQPAAGSHMDGQKNGGETGIDCGGSVKTTQPCPDGQACTDSSDCIGTCSAGTCGPIGPTDGKKNGDETDVDCGGPTAPKCANGKTCATKTDCVDDYCPDDTKKCTAPTYSDGVQNGTETDVDCGGTGAGMKTCAETKSCVVDTDCNGACNYKKKCVDIPSCRGQFGSETCGGGDASHGDDLTHITGSGQAPGHESCCRTLQVKGYTDPNQPGKIVYLDKYEITAGRMRAFLENLGGGVDAAGNAKPANVKAWIAAHRPSRWNTDWDNVLPQANFGSPAAYTVTNPTSNLLYPGQKTYDDYPKPSNQPWMVASGPQTLDTGVFVSLGGAHFYPEMIGQTGSLGTDYGASHALNCANGPGSYGYSTYWFDNATVSTYSGGTGKYFSKNVLDEKALTCSPFGLLAAFCAWDGGQLATAEVMDDVTGNTVSPVYSTGFMNGKLAPGNSSNCGGGGLPYVTYSDGSMPCGYFWPEDGGQQYDGSNRIAPPGRKEADTVAKNAGDEPWMDMIGNMHEAVMKDGETKRFDFRGYGHENTSILYHRMQYTTPRGKSGSIGGRCMRFK